MSQNVYFNGELLSIPGAYSAIDTSFIATRDSATGAKNIAILGECAGGEPGVVQFFTEPHAAKSVLKSGELLKACEKAWNPVSGTKQGVSLGGAYNIACIRTNTATKSTYSILKNQGDTKPQLKFESTDWGQNTSHQIKIVDGTLNSTKKVIIYDQTVGTYETFDNIGNLFSISYTGDQPYAEINVFLDGNNSMYLQTKIGADEANAAEDIKIKLDPNILRSMKSLILELKAYDNYVVSATNTYNTKLSVTDLDFIEKGDIKLSSGDPFRVTAIYKDLQSKLSSGSRLVNLVEFDKSKGAIDNINNYATLTGGTEGASPASWLNYFDKLSNFDIDYIVPLTSDVAIHAELLSHVNKWSKSLGRERRGIVGGDISETVDETLARARDLQSSRMQIVHGGFYDYNTDNELELYPPYILAAAHAGRAAFLDDGESATRDKYKMTLPEYKLGRTDIQNLKEGGCLAFEYVLASQGIGQSYVRLAQDITTDTINSNISLYRERATGALADAINKEIRSTLDEMLTGKRTSAAELTSAQIAVISVLEDRLNRGHILAYKDVYLTKDGDTTRVDYSVAAAEVNNFTLITGHYYSENITL